MAGRLCFVQARQGLAKLLQLQRRGPSRLLSLSASESSCGQSTSSAPGDQLIYTPEHFALRASLRKIIDKEINPFVDKWEEEGQFPAHQVFKSLGRAGFFGVNKPTVSNACSYGGAGGCALQPGPLVQFTSEFFVNRSFKL